MTIIRTVAAVVALTTFAACSQGQKGRMQLQNEMDSVSYAIGADIGKNFKRSKLDDVNIAALSMGLRDGLDSATILDEMAQQRVIEGYMMKVREKQMAEERAQGEENRLAGEKFLAENGKKPGVVTTASGLQYEVITLGTGAKPTAEDVVKVHYTGTLLDGTEFDSSVRRGQPIDYPVANFVPGWVEALQLMPVGSKWKLFIPSDLGYGAGGAPGGMIPPNSTLIFELELLDIVK